MMLDRNLLKVDIRNNPFTSAEVAAKKNFLLQNSGLNKEQINYFVFTDSIENSTYNFRQDEINILQKDGSVREISETADLLNSAGLKGPVEKHYLCYLSKQNTSVNKFE